MKSTVVTFLVAWMLGMPIFAKSQNPSDGIITKGVALLPEQIKVVKDGQETIYTPGFSDQEFVLHSDRQFSMGSTTKCDPFLGSTTEEIEIMMSVSARFKWGPYNVKTGGSEKIPVGPENKQATLIVPKGTSVFGRCQSDSQALKAVSFQSTNANDQENYFEIRWLEE